MEHETLPLLIPVFEVAQNDAVIRHVCAYKGADALHKHVPVTSTRGAGLRIDRVYRTQTIEPQPASVHAQRNDVSQPPNRHAFEHGIRGALQSLGDAIPA